MNQRGIIVNTPQTLNQSDAQDWGSLFSSIVGDVSGVMDYGNKLSVTKTDNNNIVVSSGVYSLQGHFLRVEEGKDLELSVDSGTLGVKRKDALIVRYTKNVDSEANDYFAIEVYKGTPVVIGEGEPVLPTLPNDNLLEGGSDNSGLLYEIDINETELTLVDKRKYIDSIVSLEDRLENVDEDIKNRILVEHGRVSTVTGGGAIAYPSDIELYNFMVEGVTGTDVPVNNIAWNIHFQSSFNRYLVYLYDRTSGYRLETGVNVTYTRIFNYR